MILELYSTWRWHCITSIKRSRSICSAPRTTCPTTSEAAGTFWIKDDWVENGPNGCDYLSTKLASFEILILHENGLLRDGA